MPRQPAPDKSLIVIGAIFGSIGLICLTVCALLVWWQLAPGPDMVRTTGRVVQIESRTDSEGDRLMRPVVAFEANEDEYRVTGTVWSNPPSAAVGEEVAVRYPVGQPRDAMIDIPFENWIGPAIVAFNGTIFGSIGGLCIFLWLRERRAARQANSGVRPPWEETVQ